MNLNGKTALVTGGATGIGRQICKTLANAGAMVVINYHSNKDDAEQLANEIIASGGQASFVRADVSNYADVEQMMSDTISKLGKLDILVNNAGVTADTLIVRMSEADFDKVINVNLKGSWNCCKHAVRYMMKERSGKIINISSIVGIMGNAGQTNYSASKAGVIGLTKSLAREVAKRGICVNAIAPGFIKTKMTEVLSDDMINEYTRNIPLGRLGETEDIANVVSFLASELSGYITGQVINVDGGIVMY